jgi:cell division protein YceG involved in septum cleavage
VLWILLIVVMAVAVGVALAREATKDDAPDAEPVAASVPTQKLLVREGLRREDIARLLDQETAIPGARYLALTGPGQRGRRLAGASRPTSLEGFLFPATYEITDGTTAAELVDDQLAAYDANTSQVNYAYAKSKNLTEYDVLILASMIEREVAVPRERPIVAGVMYNRLKAGMRLDIDATVQYALGEWKPELTASDLAIDSPYNTRKYAGLPPGPICNPGLDSIRAAARPAKVPYVYYVARNDGSGRHFFATTPEQFDRDVARSEANAGG